MNPDSHCTRDQNDQEGLTATTYFRQDGNSIFDNTRR